MAKYTLELRRIHESPNTQVFGFNYDFYTDDIEVKRKFEEKFIEYYYFDEIGFETVAKFKHRLRAHLNYLMPKIRKRYETELASKNIDFLLNKDLVETTTRDLQSQDSRLNKSMSNNNSSATTTANEDSTFKESALNNGNATLNNQDLTTINNTNSKGNTSTSSEDAGSTTTNGESTGTEKEIISYVSKGNIGVTSSAELLEKWRQVIIDVDQELIDKCSSLFMKIY